MQSSNMSAGGEPSSERIASPTIIAQESDIDAAWKECDVLDKPRHRSRARDYSENYDEAHAHLVAARQAPTALSIMRRQRSGSEDVLTARKNILNERNGGDEEGEGVAALRSRHARVPPPQSSPYYPSVDPATRIGYPMVPPGHALLRHHPLTVEYLARDRARWEQEMKDAELNRYDYESDPYYGSYGYHGFRGYYEGGGNHAPMPSFLGDAYRRHKEMTYGGPDVNYRPPSIPSLLPPSQQASQGQGADNLRESKPVSVSQAPFAHSSPEREMFVKDGRIYQEMDWKRDHLWREDNHTRRTTNTTHNPAVHQGPRDIVGQPQGQVGGAVSPPASASISSCSTSQVQEFPTANPSFQKIILQQQHHVHPNPAPTQHPHHVPPKKSVSFSSLQIRTYETILGDNPSCSTGPSLGLGWRYDPSHYTSTIDEYERHQSQLYHGCADPRPEDLVLHRFEREAILLSTGYTRQDLAESVRGTTKVKNRRRQTVHNLPVAWVEERMESCRRTLRRWILNKGRTRSMYEEWKKEEMAMMPLQSQGGTRGILIKRRSAQF